MKQRTFFILLIVLLLLSGLAACSPGHDGSKVIAFLRDGELITIDPSGANTFTVAAQETPIVSFSWSPNHQLLAFRALDGNFVQTAEGKRLPALSTALLTPDVPSTLNTIGVDGGSPIPIAFSRSDVNYSSPVWAITGSRLLYRQTLTSFSGNPATISWIMAQNDQPGSIAAKALPGSYSIPSLSYNAQSTLVLGNATAGVYTTDLTGSNRHVVTNTPLADHPLSASLERLLWRPNAQGEFLYAVPSGKADSLQLVLGNVTGKTTPLRTCNCTQFAWSPDGNFILSSTISDYSVFDVRKQTTFTIGNTQRAVPYWSPDSSFLLIDSPTALRLVQVANGQEQLLLGSQPQPEPVPEHVELYATNDLLQPVANSLWSADSRHIVFHARERTQWRTPAQTVTPAVYTVSLDADGRPVAAPQKIAEGKITQLGWTYQDPNTSFLY